MSNEQKNADNYKQAAEMVWVERFALLFWAAYAGSSLGDLFGG